MMMHAYISAIEYYLPEHVLTNEDLAAQFPDWRATKIWEKTGIATRHIAAPDETSTQMAIKAAEKLFESGRCDPHTIDFVLFCTQTPDYLLPSSSCIIQRKLALPASTGALDFNLGCSGYVYGLVLAKGLIESRSASNVLLLTADMYSKLLDPTDQSVRTLFGDAASATLVSGTISDDLQPGIGPSVLGTDGSGSDYLMVRRDIVGAPPASSLPMDLQSQRAAIDPYLRMNGPAILTFTLSHVPSAVAQLLKKSGRSLDDVDHFVFHQANRYLLDLLRARCGIPEERFAIEMADTGNTVSSTIPIALKRIATHGKIQPGQQAMLVGFGVGLSWGAVMVSLPGGI